MTMYEHEGQEYEELRARLEQSEARVAKLEAALEDVAVVAGGKAAERIHALLKGTP